MLGFHSLLLFALFIQNVNAFECGWTKRLATSKSNQLDDLDEDLVPEKKINHGRPVIRIENYPFVAKIGWNVEGEEHSCSGSIYDRKTILTAGHCTEQVFIYLRNSKKAEKNFTMYVKVASSNTSWDEGITINVKKVFKHPGFNRFKGFTDDIGLLTLKKKLKWTEKVQPICIPLPGNNTETLDRKNAVKIVGFGRIVDEMNSETLYIGTMYPTEDLGDYADMFDSESTFLLERKTESETCPGDSGGPVFQLRKGRYYQFGVVSAANGCTEGTIAFASSLEYFNQWIIETVGEPKY